ncbi:hypothetical protein L1887_53594 [Cichorium endivia]|nr:hypothetical protein L1887_53594 [Cichorium endivia]
MRAVVDAGSCTARLIARRRRLRAGRICAGSRSARSPAQRGATCHRQSTRRQHRLKKRFRGSSHLRHRTHSTPPAPSPRPTLPIGIDTNAALLSQKNLVRTAGVEPATSGMSNLNPSLLPAELCPVPFPLQEKVTLACPDPRRQPHSREQHLAHGHEFATRPCAAKVTQLSQHGTRREPFASTVTVIHVAELRKPRLHRAS